MIIDVRTDGEAAKGKIETSIHIPLGELELRLAEIPADKEILLHWTTGARAKMAYSFLKRHRSKVRFLHGKVSCRADRCRIKP